MFSLRAAPLPMQLPQLHAYAKKETFLQSDSRKIRQGDIFIACQGEYVDGRQFIPAAIEQGAIFVYWDDDGKFKWNPNWSVQNQGIKELRYRAGMLAEAAYGHIAEKLNIIGVTGTNGKTSITQWLAQAIDILENKKKSCAIMGTVGNGYWGELHESTHTTPDPVSVQTLLRHFANDGATHVAMEVSSHGLDQYRVNGVRFRSAIFTNLTRDHLDYHANMADYGQAKARLFYWKNLQHAIINADDTFGRELIQTLKAQNSPLHIYSYGFKSNSDICITHFQASSSGMNIHLQTPWGTGKIQTHLLGRFNAQNLAACVGALCANGYDLTQVLMALAQICPATGRMDMISEPDKPLIVIDYAHTPDALEKALMTLREIQNSDGKLWCIFGCGGNRDRGKRPLMGAIAAAHSDYPVITSDNPRMEDPQTIINDILPAVSSPALVEVDRRRAIEQTILRAMANDIILIAGKGHETYQDIQGVKQHFSDFEVARSALNMINE